MKRMFILTALVTSLFVTGLASAQNALFPSNNASADVAFYTAEPKADGVLLNTTMVNNSPFASTIDGVDSATYAVISFEGESYTFPLSESGDNKNEVWLELAGDTTAASYVSDTSTMSLATLLDGLSENPKLLEDLQRSTSEF